MFTILVVEDEIYLSRFLELELQHEGYEVTVANDGLVGYTLAKEKKFDLILLDLMLPSMNGLEICQKLRETSDLPIIILTAKEDINDKVTGLDLGANDYITKPFAIEELLARIRATLRDQKKIKNQQNKKELKVCGITLNPNTFQVFLKDQKVSLTKKEFLLLQTLMENKNIALSREQLGEQIWKDKYKGESNIVDVFIRYIRNKLEAAGGKDIITTIRGIGYVIRED